MFISHFNYKGKKRKAKARQKQRQRLKKKKKVKAKVKTNSRQITTQLRKCGVSRIHYAYAVVAHSTRSDRAGGRSTANEVGVERESRTWCVERGGGIA